MTIAASELDALKEEYLSQIRGFFPLYRAVLLFISLIIVIAAQNPQTKSVSEWALSLELRSFADLDKGFFATVTVQDALTAIGFLILGTAAHRVIRWLFFLWLRKKLNLEEIAKRMNAKSEASKDGTIVSYFALKKSESEAAIWGRKTSSLSLMSESALTLCLVFIYAGWFGNLIDVSIGAVLFVFAILALARSFIVFLRHYLPHTMHIKGLLGQSGEVKFP